MQGWDGYLSALTEEKPVVGGGSGQKPADEGDTFLQGGEATLVTFSVRTLQGGEGYLGNHLTEETRTGEKPSAF